MRAAAMAALLFAACGGDDPTVVVVTVDGRPSVADVAALEVVATNESESIQTRFDVSNRSFPLSFSITPTGRTGPLTVDVRALDADDVLRGLGRAVAEIEPATEVAASVLLDPADFVVNSSVAGNQRLTFLSERNGRQLSASSDGFAVVFVNDCAQLGRCDVFGRRFDPDGLPADNAITADSGEFIANLSEEIGSVPAIGVGPTGAFIAWETFTDVRGVALGADGGHVGFSETLLSDSDQSPGDATVAAVPAGDFVVAWAETGGGAIRGRLVEDDGTPRVNPVTNNDLDFPIATQASGTAERPSLAPTGEGHGFLAVWRNNDSLRFRLFDSNAAPTSGSEATLQSYGASAFVVGPHAAWSAADDVAVVAWGVSDSSIPELEAGQFLVRRFAATGSPEGVARILAREIPLFASAPDVEVLSGGVIGAVWSGCDAGGDGAGCGIWLQLLRPTGLALGPAILVNTTTAGDQTDPAIAAVGPDRFAVVWTDASAAAPDTAGSAVRGRMIFPDLDPDDGRVGARCGQPGTAPCDDGLVCIAGSDGTAYCHEGCDPDGAEPICPFGGVCTSQAGQSACVF